MTLAASQAPDDLVLARLVAQYWRLVPDEDLIGRTPPEMVAATASHRDLAAQRLPGELRLRAGRGYEGGHTVLEVTGGTDVPFSPTIDWFGEAYVPWLRPLAPVSEFPFSVSPSARSLSVEYRST